MYRVQPASEHQWSGCVCSDRGEVDARIRPFLAKNPEILAVYERMRDGWDEGEGLILAIGVGMDRTMVVRAEPVAEGYLVKVFLEGGSPEEAGEGHGASSGDFSTQVLTYADGEQCRQGLKAVIDLTFQPTAPTYELDWSLVMQELGRVCPLEMDAHAAAANFAAVAPQDGSVPALPLAANEKWVLVACLLACVPANLAPGQLPWSADGCKLRMPATWVSGGYSPVTVRLAWVGDTEDGEVTDPRAQQEILAILRSVGKHPGPASSSAGYRGGRSGAPLGVSIC